MSLLENFFRPEQLAAEIGIHVRTLRKWDELGIGPAKTQIGRLTLYRIDTVREWLESRELRKNRKAGR